MQFLTAEEITIKFAKAKAEYPGKMLIFNPIPGVCQMHFEDADQACKALDLFEVSTLNGIPTLTFDCGDVIWIYNRLSLKFSVTVV